MGWFRKFLKLTLPSKILVLKALVAVARGSIILHVFPSSYVTRTLGRQHSVLRPPSRHSVDQIVWSIAAVARHVPGASCLVRAIALTELMLANGHECKIEIGVEKSSEGEFGAHSWVRHEGKVILGGDTERYRLIASFPRPDQQEGP